MFDFIHEAMIRE